MLLGDSLFDHHMADGLIEEDIRENIGESDVSVILKIGFLNAKVGVQKTRILDTLALIMFFACAITVQLLSAFCT